MQFEYISTPRLKLRKLTQEVFDYVYQNFKEDELKRFLGVASNEALEIERNKYTKGLSTHNKKFLYYHILKPQSDEVIGWLGFHTWYIDHARAEIGYGWFSDEYKQKGLMYEAIIPVLKYGFSVMNLNRVEAFVGKANVASLALLNKLNFVKEGVMREHYSNKNKLEDSLVFSLLKSDYIL